MNKVDKLCRDSKIVVDSVKDTLEANLLTAFQDKTIALSQADLEKVLAIVGVSFSEGFTRSISSFGRKALETLTSP